MILRYFQFALRNFRQQKLFTFINMLVLESCNKRPSESMEVLKIGLT
jgi:hypothetical protein